jgi:hypothetical protein
MMRKYLLAGCLFTSPATAQPAAFLVFFDWNQATLTGQAHQIIRQAADLALRTRAPVVVNGFTDTSGTVGYNNGLSWRRVEAVAGELERDGIPRSALHAQGYGETYPRVPTPNEVREPQNRRVQITVQRPVMMPPPSPMVLLPYPYPYWWPPRPWSWYGRPWGYYHRPW